MSRCGSRESDSPGISATYRGGGRAVECPRPGCETRLTAATEAVERPGHGGEKSVAIVVPGEHDRWHSPRMPRPPRPCLRRTVLGWRESRQRQRDRRKRKREPALPVAGRSHRRSETAGSLLRPCPPSSRPAARRIGFSGRTGVELKDNFSHSFFSRAQSKCEGMKCCTKM